MSNRYVMTLFKRLHIATFIDVTSRRCYLRLYIFAGRCHMHLRYHIASASAAQYFTAWGLRG